MLHSGGIHRLNAPVAGVIEALPVLDALHAVPPRMVLLSVLADIEVDSGPTALTKLTFFFTREGRKDAWCRFDNEELTLVCSGPYPTPHRPDGWVPIELKALKVDVSDALAAADRVVAARTADRNAPDLLVDVVLRSERGRCVWAVSYDIWLEEGPGSYHHLLVDAVSGEVEVVTRDAR